MLKRIVRLIGALLCAVLCYGLMVSIIHAPDSIAGFLSGILFTLGMLARAGIQDTDQDDGNDDDYDDEKYYPDPPGPVIKIEEHAEN